MNGYKAPKAKVFMRTDQAKDEASFSFPDASKLRASRVDLKWRAIDLYGLLFHLLRERAGDSFTRILGFRNINDETVQRAVFTELAGEYMGSDHRRGRTYTWVIAHLADAFHETTPRSFLITLQRAARSGAKLERNVIDHHGIREGVQYASEVRVDQLREDYPWIKIVISALEGLEVPCAPNLFITRWREKKNSGAGQAYCGRRRAPRSNRTRKGSS